MVLFHILDGAVTGPAFLRTLIRKGYLGVDLFFVLSGFILMHVYAAAHAAGRYDHRSFLLNRFARVYPLHAAMLVAFLLAYAVAGALGLAGAAEGMNWAHLPWHVLLLHAWGTTDGHSWNFPSWSVSAEVFAYLLFPAYLVLAARVRPWIGLILALVAFSGVWIAVAAAGGRLTALMYDFGILRIAVEFALGVALYRIFQARTGKGTGAGAVNRSANRIAVVVLALAILVGAAAGVSDLVLVPLLTALVLPLAQLSRTAPAPGPVQATFVYLGEISYSTYMVHFLVIIAVEAVLSRLGVPFAVQVAVMLAGIYAASALLYHGVELPARRRIRTLARGPRADRPAGQSPAGASSTSR